MGNVDLKPLHVNPVKLSQPMGATLAFLGVDKCMPLMHGGQGCASFTKVFMTRHFSDPIAIQTTAVTDITAVLDGGAYSITESIKNITEKVTPSLIGLHTTGLTETKGDDIKGVTSLVEYPLVYVNTPDYEGGLESGWALTVSALIEQLTLPSTMTKAKHIAVLPHVSMLPLEVEQLKEFLEELGLRVSMLPDISLSLDGHLGEKQTALSSGGTSIDEILRLAQCEMVLSIGESMKSCGEVLRAKNEKMCHLHVKHLSGLVHTDVLVAKLLEASIIDVSKKIERWRKRLQDALLDTHAILGSKRFALIGEPDHIAAQAAALAEAGGKVSVAIASTPSPILETIDAEEVMVGDFEDLEDRKERYDVIIGNYHAERITHKYHKDIVLRGYPNWEEVGSQLKSDLLYEGSCQFLFEVANKVSDHEPL